MIQKCYNLLYFSLFNRISEQRRKRLQELEQKISALNKKITEQEKIIKMKEKNDEKITQLNSEIQVCSQTTHYFQKSYIFKVKNISGCHENRIYFFTYTFCCEYKCGV